MLGMSERQLMRHVYWPSALSWMFSSLHTSVGFAVVGAVVGEYLGSAAGARLPDPAGRRHLRRRRASFAGMFVLSAFVIPDRLLRSTLVERRPFWSGGRTPARRRGVVPNRHSGAMR